MVPLLKLKAFAGWASTSAGFTQMLQYKVTTMVTSQAQGHAGHLGPCHKTSTLKNASDFLLQLYPYL